MSKRTTATTTTKVTNTSRVTMQSSTAIEEGSVSQAAFSFLFSDMCSRAYTYPTKVKSVEEVEARLTALGAHVGARLLLFSSLRENPANPSSMRRPHTAEAALRLIQEKMWAQWFGRAANEMQRESNSDRFFIVDSEPLVLRDVYPSPDYLDAEGSWTVNYASFVGGIVQGALETMGFPCEVVTYHQPAPDKPKQSVFVVEFAKQVWDRERRPRV